MMSMLFQLVSYDENVALLLAPQESRAHTTRILRVLKSELISYNNLRSLRPS
jgi:succinylarginine dihydrolase